MKVEVNGDALKLLEDFVKYANIDSGAMADLMQYDYTAFLYRLSLLEQALNKSKS